VWRVGRRRFSERSSASNISGVSSLSSIYKLCCSSLRGSLRGSLRSAGGGGGGAAQAAPYLSGRVGLAGRVRTPPSVRRQRSEGAAAAQRLAAEVTAEVAAEILALCAQLLALHCPLPCYLLPLTLLPPLSLLPPLTQHRATALQVRPAARAPATAAVGDSRDSRLARHALLLHPRAYSALSPRPPAPRASPVPTPRLTLNRCDLRPCGILSLRRAGARGRADVERGGAESQEQAAQAERLAELSAKLRLWRLLFFALSEYLGPAEGAEAPTVG